MSEIRKRIIFHGRVQGVGFRYTAKYLARSLGLTGWVENEYDGTVILEVQGREALIYKLMEGLNRNQFITIDWIDTEEIPVEKEQSFYVKSCGSMWEMWKKFHWGRGISGNPPSPIGYEEERWERVWKTRV